LNIFYDGSFGNFSDTILFPMAAGIFFAYLINERLQYKAKLSAEGEGVPQGEGNAILLKRPANKCTK
jgi:hypothetical protein